MNYLNVRRVATGPEIVRASDAGRVNQEAHPLWPFPWVYPPSKSSRRDPTGFIVMPAIGVTALVFQYKVSSGFYFEMTELMFCSVTTGFVPIANPGDVLYTINYNTPSTGTAAQQSPLADFQNIAFPFGSPIQGPVRLPRSQTFAPIDTVSLYATNVGANAGVPNYIVGMFGGWEREA